jgi:hypothetical protein
MIQIDSLPVTPAVSRSVDAIIGQYRVSPAVATERAIAVLALWMADAILAGRLAPRDADAAFVRLYVELGNPPVGPGLSEDTTQLLMEGMTLDHWGTELSGDLGEMRRLAFAILGEAAQSA